MPRKKTFIDNQYHGTKLCDTPREFSYDYIRAIDGVITTMTERHSKVLVVRFDLRYPKDHNADNSNRDFSGTLQGVCREFSRKGYDPQYVARREQVTSENQHYHVGILLDGKELLGYGGEMGSLAFCVPQDPDWMNFCKLMKDAEMTFCANISQYTLGEENAL